MEIGGYIEFPHYTGSVFHNNAIALNCARNCLVYVIEAKNVKKIALAKNIAQALNYNYSKSKR